MKQRESPIRGPGSTPAHKQPRLSDIDAGTDDDHGRGERGGDNGSSRTGGRRGSPAARFAFGCPPHAATGRAAQHAHAGGLRPEPVTPVPRARGSPRTTSCGHRPRYPPSARARITPVRDAVDVGVPAPFRARADHPVNRLVCGLVDGPLPARAGHPPDPFRRPCDGDPVPRARGSPPVRLRLWRFDPPPSARARITPPPTAQTRPSARFRTLAPPSSTRTT